MAALKTQYETDKKDQEIQLLSVENKLKIKEAERQRENKKMIAGGSFAFCIVLGFGFYNFYNRKKETFNRTVEQVNNKALRAQMNPHFIFNSLNSIDDYIQNNDLENSSLYINKFSRLIRIILENSRTDEVCINEDLEALELYIQLENLRMQNKVDYTIDIAADLNTEQTLIPPMLLQPFVENAFKHAFNGVNNPTLEIKIGIRNDMIHCIVIDNGRGRENKQKLLLETKAKRESLGLRVTKERLDVINQIKKSKAYIAFEDLKDINQNALGTKVELAVPALYAF